MLLGEADEFPKFWFEGNLYFNWVSSTLDLEELFERYEGTLTKDELLDRSMNNPDSEGPYFGLRRVCSGTKSLRKYLNKHLGKNNY